MSSDDDKIEVHADERAEAHRALDVWLDELAREATHRQTRGVAGYLGSLKLSAFHDDDINLELERGISTSIR